MTWTRESPGIYRSAAGVLRWETAARLWWWHPADGSPRVGPFVDADSARDEAERKADPAKGYAE
jgi:hypothetical protein